MDVGSRKQRSDVTDLPDEHLYVIFEKLDSKLDREAFGLTCHRFLNIHDSSRKLLNLHHLNCFEKSNRSGTKVDSLMLQRLLNRFKQLESLTLTGCKDVTDTGLGLLQKYDFQLRSIQLDFCPQITDVGFSFIASGCPSLSTISLFSTSIGNSGLKILTTSCNSLTNVSLGWCINITDRGIQYLMKNCRQLKALRISGCSKIKGLGFKGCSSTLATLEADSCVFAKGLTEALSGGGLEYLNLALLSKRTGGHVLATIGNSGFAANLKTLKLSGCIFVTDDVILSISKGCPLLKEWILAGCKNITISGWESIGLHCKNLEMINVAGCLKLCDGGLLALGNSCRRLSVIYVDACPLITPSGIQRFRTQSANVKIRENVSFVPRELGI